MLDLTKPLQSKNGFKATILHTYYNGVRQMMVVSLNRGPTCSLSDAKDVEIIKIYDTRWGKLDGAPPMTPADSWDLEEVPPADKIGYVCVYHHGRDTEELDAISYSIKQDLTQTSALGQIKVVIDGRTGKLKTTEIV